ncbi:MAG: flagellar biosynthetic protein FliO [Alkalispirochaeta sp.]
MVLVLLMVVGAVYGLISLLRRRVNRPEEEDDSPIRVLATRTVGASQIYAVMVGRQVLLLGGGDGGLELITRVEDQETIDELVLAHSAGTGRSAPTFGAVFTRWIGNLAVPGSGSGKASRRGGGTPEGGTVQSNGVSFFRTQSDRLRKLR